MPSLDDFKQFLKSRADLLETLETNHSDRTLGKQKGHSHYKTKSFIAQKGNCAYCNGEHYIQARARVVIF
jgi:hypothetical protein